MPNGLSKIAITYGAADIQRADLSLHIDIESGLDEFPEYVGADRALAGADGMLEGPRRARRLPIVLKGWIRASSAAGYRTLVEDLRTLFDPKVPANLVATRENGSTATIRARTDAIVWDGEERIGETREFRVNMHSIAPFWTIT